MTKEKLGEVIIDKEDSLYRIAKTLLYNDADCADAIQESIVKAFSSVDTLRNHNYVKTWLVRILMNECYSIMRKEKKFVSLDSIMENAYYEDNEYIDLYKAVADLPTDLKIAVSLYYSEGFSIKEIAKLEDTTESSIKNRLFRARKRLKLMLKEEEAINL